MTSLLVGASARFDSANAAPPDEERASERSSVEAITKPGAVAGVAVLRYPVALAPAGAERKNTMS